MRQQIRSTQAAEVSRVKELQKKVEHEIARLKMRDDDLEKISDTLDHSQFLHDFSSLPALSRPPDFPGLEIRPQRYFEAVAAVASKLSSDSDPVSLKEPEPRSREDFLRYSHKITLDPNTEH